MVRAPGKRQLLSPLNLSCGSWSWSSGPSAFSPWLLDRGGLVPVVMAVCVAIPGSRVPVCSRRESQVLVCSRNGAVAPEDGVSPSGAVVVVGLWTGFIQPW